MSDAPRFLLLKVDAGPDAFTGRPRRAVLAVDGRTGQVAGFEPHEDSGAAARALLARVGWAWDTVRYGPKVEITGAQWRRYERQHAAGGV
jgi:hypothetical protein